MTPVNILINVIDDEAIWRELIFEQLSPDYQVVAYSNSNDFFAAFTPLVDLVILDVRLKDGTDVLERIQRIYDVSPNCYLIVVSAYLDVPLMQSLIRMRVNDTIVKNEQWLPELHNAVIKLTPKLIERAEMMRGSLK